MPYRKVALVGSGEPALLAARLAGGISLACWIGPMIYGRYLTFYLPPLYYWCPWC